MPQHIFQLLLAGIHTYLSVTQMIYNSHEFKGSIIHTQFPTVVSFWASYHQVSVNIYKLGTLHLKFCLITLFIWNDNYNWLFIFSYLNNQKNYCHTFLRSAQWALADKLKGLRLKLSTTTLLVTHWLNNNSTSSNLWPLIGQNVVQFTVSLISFLHQHKEY